MALERMTEPANRFWEGRSLHELSRQEWECLCDHCGKCCVHRLQDEDTGELFFTNVACRLLEQSACRCTEYARRAALVAECVVLTSQNLTENARWLPATCAYRLLAEGRQLPRWHPLVSGSDGTVWASGQSVCGRVISEIEADADLRRHLVPWW